MIDHEARGRFLVQAMWSELEKIAGGPLMVKEAEPVDSAVGDSEVGVPPPLPEEEPAESPVQEIMGVSVQQISDKRARGVPVVQPPPGYIYNPELAAFVPNPQDPGWLTEGQAQIAFNNKNYYDQGQQTAQVGAAQAEADATAQQAAEDVAAEQAQGPQPATQPAPRPPVKTPEGISGVGQKPPKKKPPQQKQTGSVRINIGR